MYFANKFFKTTSFDYAESMHLIYAFSLEVIFFRLVDFIKEMFLLFLMKMS
jgi:hypothetical protein